MFIIGDTTIVGLVISPIINHSNNTKLYHFLWFINQLIYNSRDGPLSKTSRLAAARASSLENGPGPGFSTEDLEACGMKVRVLGWLVKKWGTHIYIYDIIWYCIYIYDIISCYMILYDIVWYHMISYDIIWYYMILYDITGRF